MTIRSDATRINENGNSTVFSDAGLKTLVADLKTVFDNNPEADVVAEVRSDLDTTYGAGKVTEVIAIASFEEVWNPVTRKWERKEITGSMFTIDDGGTNLLRAKVHILADA